MGPRERRVNMATWLCSQMRDALNLDCEDGSRELSHRMSAERMG